MRGEGLEKTTCAFVEMCSSRTTRDNSTIRTARSRTFLGPRSAEFRASQSIRIRVYQQCPHNRPDSATYSAKWVCPRLETRDVRVPASVLAGCHVVGFQVLTRLIPGT
jgi:hypothetical protein